MIFSLITDYNDALALALTSTYFWSVGKPHIESLLTRRRSPEWSWSGNRIILVGSGTDSLPPGLDVEYLGPPPSDGEDDERAWDLLSALDEDINCSIEGGIFIRPIAVSGKYLADHRDFGCVGKTANFNPWLKPFDRRVQTLRNAKVRRETNPDGSFAAQEWILRNLTKKAYTREDGGPCGSLDHRLIVRSCWSSEIGSIQLHPEPESLRHGPWAGDRFDVVPLGDLELVLMSDGKVGRVEGWKDVTDDVRKEIDAICMEEASMVFP